MESWLFLRLFQLEKILKLLLIVLQSSQFYSKKVLLLSCITNYKLIFTFVILLTFWKPFFEWFLIKARFLWKYFKKFFQNFVASYQDTSHCTTAIILLMRCFISEQEFFRRKPIVILLTLFFLHSENVRQNCI